VRKFWTLKNSPGLPFKVILQDLEVESPYFPYSDQLSRLVSSLFDAAPDGFAVGRDNAVVAFHLPQVGIPLLTFCRLI
jgi:hypothetical protein